MLTVDDLVHTSHLGITVLAGHAGLSRRVLWSHVAEIEDTANWLDGGELLMTTGLGIPASASGQVAYLSRLDEVRAAALGIGQRAPELTPQLFAEAERRRFPVLRIDEDVPFLAIARLIAAANGDTAQARMATQVLIYDSLRSRVERKRSVPQLFEHLGGIVGYDLFVVSRRGRALMPGLPDVPPAIPASIADVTDRTPSVPGGVAVPVPLAGRTAAYLVGVERQGVDPAGLGALRHIATIAALELSDLYLARDAALERGGEALADMLAGRLGRPEAERAIEAAGLHADAPLVLGAVRSLKDRRPPRQELYHRLQDAGVGALMLRGPEAMFVLLEREAEDTLGAALSDLGLFAGMSSPLAGLHDISTARMQAMWAVQWPAAAHAGGITHFNVSNGWMTWLPHDVADLRRIVEHTFAPLVQYDQQNQTELLHTLRVFLRNERNISRSADELCIHKHTLQYRLRRIRDISGRSMASTQDVAELWFTFQAEALVEASGTGG